MNLHTRISHHLSRKSKNYQDQIILRKLVAAISSKENKDVLGVREENILFFNASTRLEGLSQNAAFSILAAKALESQGIPVTHFVCNKGMSRCVLGTKRDDVTQAPPCQRCIKQSKNIFPQNRIVWFTFHLNKQIEKELISLNLDQMTAYEHNGIPLGQITLPALRWILRKHHLADDRNTRGIFKEFILSAWNISEEFSKILESNRPKTVVIFNGQFFPEATVRYLCLQNGIRVISHEVALQPLTAFFTNGEATAYPIKIPDEFRLSRSQDNELNLYLQQRFHGKFSMAGIKFWPEMRELGNEFWEKTRKFKQVVPIFTNVVFDTSQGHANTLFSDMFAWLDLVLESIKKHPDTFFIIRAHPDESRKGKESRESVAEWIRRKHVCNLPNVLFVGPDDYFSSYEIIQKSKFVMVYNSTIGLESSIMGMPVLCAGKARYTQYPTVFFPKNVKAYQEMLIKFLKARRVNVPANFKENAKKFLYFQLFRTSLSFEKFLTSDANWNGYVHLKTMSIEDLFPENSKTMQVIINGILKNERFLLK
jgi:hypothetical protein